MYKGQTVIDIHGHMSTPPQFRAYAYNMVALRISADSWKMSDELVESALGDHLRMLDERNIDVQMISPRPVAMMHWERPFMVEAWTKITNNTIHQQCVLHPDRFLGVAQLPQNEALDTTNCLPELRRCVEELGFVAALVNPDPGANRQTPGMNREYWFPLYEEAQKLQVPLIVHPSISRDPRLDGMPASYQYNNVTEEALATLLLENSDVFERYPELRIVVCHCGGALDRMLGDRGQASGLRGGGSVGMNIGNIEQAGPREKDLSNNLTFDTCAYDPDFMATAIKQRGVDRMLFGTEVPGGGTVATNPWTGKVADDLIPVLEQMDFLSDDDRLKILNGNARRLFPRLKLPT
jgi:predicted TIM-barrel fold metal-dependent hydrolase